VAIPINKLILTAKIYKYIKNTLSYDFIQYTFLDVEDINLLLRKLLKSIDKFQTIIINYIPNKKIEIGLRYKLNKIS
jgi:hypothetical protein